MRLKGVEAQTLANAFAAMNAGLHIVPFINKIDLPNARIDEVLVEMEHTLAIDSSEVLQGQRQGGPGHQGAARRGHRPRAAAEGRSRRRLAGDGV